MELEILEQAICYLKVLQDGRVKPDRNSEHPTVRDSIDSLQHIKTMTDTLTNFFQSKLSTDAEGASDTE